MAFRRIDQKMALRAHHIVGNDISDAWRTRLRQLPAQLRGGGLPATYADLMAQSDKSDPKLSAAYRRLIDEIAKHVNELELLEVPVRTPDEFLKALAAADLTTYARICAEVEALSTWMSRLVEALYVRPKETAGGH